MHAVYVPYFRFKDVQIAPMINLQCQNTPGREDNVGKEPPAIAHTTLIKWTVSLRVGMGRTPMHTTMQQYIVALPNGKRRAGGRGRVGGPEEGGSSEEVGGSEYPSGRV